MHILKINCLSRLLICQILLLTVSCVSNDRHDRQIPDDKLAEYRMLWQKYNLAAEYDSIVSSASDFYMYSLANRDTLSAAYSCAYIAQSSLFLEDLDAVEDCLVKSDSLLPGADDARLAAMLQNIKGIYAIKSELNYSKALYHFFKQYEIVRNSDDRMAKMVSLTNIVNTFYIRSDKYGMRYARQAMSVADEYPDDKYINALASLSMAQMSYLCGNTDSAYIYVCAADKYSDIGEIESQKSVINLLYADILLAQGREEAAVEYYKAALADYENAEPGIISLIYLNYGKYCESADPAMAVSLYRNGLNVSYKYRNALFRNELLRRLSDVYYEIGNKDEAYRYSRMYSVYSDTVSVIQREQDFSSLLLSYQDMEHQTDVHVRELALLNARKKILVFVLCCIIMGVVLLSLWLLYRKQKKMYSSLVNQHQSYLKRIAIASELIKSDGAKSKVQDITLSDSEKNLFMRIEHLMQTEKFFKSKDISLDKVAERLETNRTYISRAINSISGMTFYSYVNMYRINEATRIISESTGEILLKQLSDDLGYNSVQVFSKSFQKETGLSPSQYRRQVMAQRGKE